MALIYVMASAQHSLKKFPFPINSDYHNEVSPVLNHNRNQLFFTRIGSVDFNKTLIVNGEDLFTTLSYDEYLDRLAIIYQQIAQYPINDPVHSPFNQDVIAARLKGDTIIRVVHPGYPLNNALPNSICSVFGEGEDFLALNIFDEDGGMTEGFSMVTIDQHLQSNFPRPLTIRNFKHTGQNINASLSTDQQHLFLSIYNGQTGNKDLYLSIKINDTTYAEPQPLASVNTEHEEITPFISKDKTKLYFASNRPGGQGAYDIYYVERLDYSYLNWTSPIPFNPPLNSVNSESYPHVVGDEIFFTSDRDGTSDIFKVKTHRVDNAAISIRFNVRATKADGSHFPSEIKWGHAYGERAGDWSGYFRSKDGLHSFVWKENSPLAIMAENRNLSTLTRIIDPQELYEQGIREMEVHLILGEQNEVVAVFTKSLVSEESILPENVTEGATIVLNNIYFKRSTPDVMDASMKAIEKLASVLMKRTALVISIDGHTDNVGDKKNLRDLSLLRASTIKNKLMELGVRPEQILTRGFGGDKPLNDNATEEKRQQNRRVEITILKNQ